MPKKIKSIAIVIKPQNTDDLSNLIPNLCRWLKKRDIKIFFLTKESERLSKIFSSKSFSDIDFLDEKKIFKEAQLVISLGGDGTLIGLCRNLKTSIPIFGINRGNLGFITEYGKNDFYDQLEDVIRGKYLIEKKSLFSAHILRKEKEIHKNTFFNDAVVTKNDIARMFSITVTADDEHVYNLSGDGIIVSTPIGSTAYSLAAGGPIVNPNVKALILTPISAHALSHRPIVMEDSSVINIKPIPPFKSVILTLDGQVVIEIQSQDTVVIKKQRKLVSFIKNPTRSYYRTLKEKFGHGK